MTKNSYFGSFFKYLALFFSGFLLFSCYKQEPVLDGRYPVIKTYISPSSYHKKPISRLYSNPYGSDYYFDNDDSYVPPLNYGTGHYDNYYPSP